MWQKRVLVPCVLLIACAAEAIAARPAQAGTCYVSPTGNDGSGTPGNPATPLRTVAQALTRGTAACNPIVLLDGIYTERIKVQQRNESPGAPLVIKANNVFTPGMPPGAGAILDGGITPVDASMPRQAVVAIYDSSYVKIEGLRIRQNASLFCPQVALSSSLCNSAGIDVRDLSQVFGQPPINGPSSHHIFIVGNEISDVRAATVKARVTSPVGACSGAMEACTSGSDCFRRYDAVPLSIYGSRDGVNASGQADPAEATNHIEVIGNHLHHNDNNSDCNGNPVINVSANVENVLIESNTIRDILPTSTALPMSPGITVRGERYAGLSAVLEGARRARKVVVRSNVFFRISGPATYVQSANNVLFERNNVRRCTIGVQVATEGAVAQPAAGAATRARQVWIRNNLLRQTGSWSIDLGMQSSTYSPVDDVHVTNNSILFTPQALPTFLRFQVVLRAGVGGDSRFGNNVVRMLWPQVNPNCTPGGGVACDHLLLRSTSGGFPMSAAIDHNLWYVDKYPVGNGYVGAPLWCPFNGVSFACQNFAAHQGAIESTALAADAQITNYHISTSSPARNSGQAVTPSWVTSGGGNPLANFGDYALSSSPEKDYYGQARVQGASIDRGMEELP